MQREAGLCPQRDAALPQCMGGRILPALEVQLRLQQVRVNTLWVASGHLLQQLSYAREVVLPVQRCGEPPVAVGRAPSSL